MYGFSELKERIEVTEETVECPVRGCPEVVRRRRKSDKGSTDFICPVHRLDISPSTFSYADDRENMLWTDESDLALFSDLKSVKRESRICANNSEDAVSWNVFRYLERADLLGVLVEEWTGIRLVSPRIIYWSWAQEERDKDTEGDWSDLNRARREFGEVVSRGSEPDIIVIGDNAVVFIEAKVTASNETVPTRPEVEAGYVNGGNKWYETMFTRDFQTIACDNRKYELLRFWLLGSWLASDVGADFHLVNLVLPDRETDIESRFGQFIVQHDHARFSRKTWEDAWRFVATAAPESDDRRRLLDYFENHTLGYEDGTLQRAFRVSR
ncbi:hypothetical protein ACFL6X_09635 [Candidatus Latescibacterota bacterium]